MESPPTSIDKNNLEKIKDLEERNKYLENENQLQKQLIKSLNDQIELLKEKIQNMEKNDLKPNNNTNVPQKSNVTNNSSSTPASLSPEFRISETFPHILSKYHLNKIFCIAILKNQRLVSGGCDGKIIIYDKNYSKAELEIVEHKGAITSLVVSSTGDLISSSCDVTKL